MMASRYSISSIFHGLKITVYNSFVCFHISLWHIKGRFLDAFHFQANLIIITCIPIFHKIIRKKRKICCCRCLSFKELSSNAPYLALSSNNLLTLFLNIQGKKIKIIGGNQTRAPLYLIHSACAVASYLVKVSVGKYVDFTRCFCNRSVKTLTVMIAQVFPTMWSRIYNLHS